MPISKTLIFSNREKCSGLKTQSTTIEAVGELNLRCVAGSTDLHELSGEVRKTFLKETNATTEPQIRS